MHDSIMNISQFNKELGIKISRAKVLEKNNDLRAAIGIWLEISEMTLNFSKSRNLEVSFRNMIINRTKGIFQHIKNLKAGQFKEESFREHVKTQEKIPQVESPPVVDSNLNNTMPEIEEQESNHVELAISNNKIIEESDFKNIPKGFKEIITSETFKIITPHDENYVKKHLSQDKNTQIFKDKKDGVPEEHPKSKEERFEFEQTKDSKTLICFACGYDNNSKEDKICKNCGTTLN
ncbi:hypothetical protein LCGC14_2156460 [marine sediment metagenome]|uniref:Zinc ribbon domain-containing protein n=1 Tax=marine sediment metagenome TaxID=412755 RepID=A0A0F9G737_9ZZZZ